MADVFSLIFADVGHPRIMKKVEVKNRNLITIYLNSDVGGNFLNMLATN